MSHQGQATRFAWQPLDFTKMKLAVRIIRLEDTHIVSTLKRSMLCTAGVAFAHRRHARALDVNAVQVILWYCLQVRTHNATYVSGMFSLVLATVVLNHDSFTNENVALSPTLIYLAVAHVF